MNTKLIDAIAKAVLYEGYMLYPYRPSSVKNRQRFNFGVLYPKSYSEAQTGSDTWTMQTECLIQAGSPAVEVRVRFLKLVARTVRDLTEPAMMPSAPWQEAIEFEVSMPCLQNHCSGILFSPQKKKLSFCGMKAAGLSGWSIENKNRFTVKWK